MNEKSFNKDFDKLKEAFYRSADQHLEELRKEILDNQERYIPSEAEIRLYFVTKGDKK